MSIYVFPTDIVGAIGIASIPHTSGGDPRRSEEQI